MFEKITKGEFNLPHLAKDDCSCDCGFFFEGNSGKMIATIHKTGDNDTYSEYPTAEEAKANAEFIAYCFNLQQRFDIGKLEEMVEFLEEIRRSVIPIRFINKSKDLLAKIRKP